MHEDQTNYTIKELITHLEWYNDYILGDLDIPENVADFSSRNIDITNCVKSLIDTISQYRKCIETQDFSFTPKEVEFKKMYALLNMMYMIRNNWFN